MSVEAEVEGFLADYAAAWNAFDTDAVAAFIRLPLMQITGPTTQFLEDQRELEDVLDSGADAWQARGVTVVAARVIGIKPLPDDAARADVEWRLSDSAGALLLSFRARYTLAAEAGQWAIVVADMTAAATAEAAAGWR